ncbi:MAG TPA: GntR family transcriptional regulator [Draconibacterium sp.]|nr:GntR family transcriptional regulator [Draconibacterium sp.]
MLKRIIHIDPKSSLPKYRQIVNSLLVAIEKKALKKGDKVPSINEICSKLNLSRDTVMLAFSELKAKGVLLSQPGKGYYIITTEITYEENIFVLFDELNSFKEDLYNSLMASFKSKGVVDIYFHHFNFKVFKSLVAESMGNYTSYVIMPATFDNTSHLLSKFPKDKVYILDRLKPDLRMYPAVYQDFENDFYDALNQGLFLLKKYRKLIFVHAGGKEPGERVKGFERFCIENGFKHQVVKSLEGLKPELYEAYFVISDNDLVEIVKIAKEYKYKLGKKFGIVSFNDTVLKEVVAGGITTISSDFVEMGKTLADMVLNKKTGHYRNPSKLIIRNSL